MIGFPGKPSQPHGRMKNSCRLTVGHTNTNRQWQYKMQDVAVLSSKHVFEMIFYATTLGLSASSASVGPYTGPHSTPPRNAVRGRGRAEQDIRLGRSKIALFINSSSNCRSHGSDNVKSSSRSQLSATHHRHLRPARPRSPSLVW